MDPGTALAIVSLSLQVLTSVKDYYELWKNCEQDVHDLRGALQRLSTVLYHLESTLQKPFFEQAIIPTICNACQQLDQGVEEIKTLLAKVKGHGSLSSMLQRVKHAGRRACYPLRASTVARFMEIIEDMTGHLGLALQVLSL